MMKNQLKIVLPSLPSFHPDERGFMHDFGVDARFISEIAANSYMNSSTMEEYADDFTEMVGALMDSELTTQDAIDYFHSSFHKHTDDVYSIAMTMRNFLSPYLDVFKRDSDGTLPYSAMVGVSERNGKFIMEISFY